VNECPPGEHDVPSNVAGGASAGETCLRSYWPNQLWRKSRGGTRHLDADGFNLVVSHRGGEWTVFI
jgi:hypothetical protein